MGRSSTVGNRAGKLIASLNAAGQDTGVILGVNIIAGKPGVGDLPMGYRNVNFQLVPGDMTAGDVTIYGTYDKLTSIDQGDAWEPVVAPSTDAQFSWSNPLSSQPGSRLLKTDAQFIAYRAVTSVDFNGTTTKLLVMAGP